MLDEFSQVIEFKELFPNDYKEIEQSLKDRIQDHKNQLIRKREEDARFEAQLRAHREQLAKEQERQQAIEFRKTLESDRKMQIEADRAHLRSKVGECTTEPEKLAYIAIQSKLEHVIREGFNHTALINNNEPRTNPYAEILRLMDDREVYDFKKKLEIILNQCADSKSKDYDDTFRSWGTRPSYYDNFDSSAKYIVAIQSIIDDQVQEGGVLAYEKAFPDKKPIELLGLIMSSREKVIEAINAKAQQSAPVYLAWFGWEPPLFDGRMRSFHCLDISFWLKNTDVMLTHTGGGKRPRDLSTKMTDALLSFMRTGSPNCASLPEWPQYTPDKGATMMLNDQCEVVYDPDREARKVLTE